MALQLKYTTQYGFALDAAYIRIVNNISASKTEVFYRTEVFTNEASKVAGLPAIPEPVATYGVLLSELESTLQASELIAALYMDLKKRDDFKEAVDC